ncbi:M48 family metalloprotease [uncultured Veillonella sp.]|uniref:M48 family metalloprotease n=1 Tax=uncultured Veillonella sp. TaxID=159268 RepID=UPI00260C7FCA|nr:M48 family metalloprotease [uncultured Veillonella sp.]
MGIIILLLSIIAYGFIGVVMLRLLYDMLELLGWHQLFLQPFIISSLEYLHIPVERTFIVAAWVLLFILSFILIFQLPFVHSLFLTFQNVHKPDGALGKYLQNAWHDVCRRANVNPQNYTLYVQDSHILNAFAYGHNRVIVMTGLLSFLNETELRGILAHELSHLVHHDTTYSLTYVAVQIAYSFFIKIFICFNNILAAIYNVLRFIPIINLIALLFLFQIKILNYLILFLQSIVHYLFMFLKPFGSRRDEYRADAFAHKLGLGEALAAALSKLSPYSYDAPGVFNQLLASHPPIHKRITRLQKLIATK